MKVFQMKVTKEDLNWCDEPILGMALLVMENEAIDSSGTPIEPRRYYEVGKHPGTGKVAILPTEKFEPKSESMDRLMKKFQKG